MQEKWPNLPKNLPIDPEVIRQGYNFAVNKLKEARQHAKTLREAHLEQRAALYSALGEQGKHKAVRRLIRAESQKRVYNKIRYLRQKEINNTGTFEGIARMTAVLLWVFFFSVFSSVVEDRDCFDDACKSLRRAEFVA